MKGVIHILKDFFLVSALFLLIPAFVFMDVVYFGHGMSEYGFVENYQLLSLLLITTYCWQNIYIYKDKRSFNIMLLGFFTIILIRELDWLFDFVSHGFWKYIALLIMISVMTISLSNKNNLMKSVESFLKSRQYYVFMVGLVIVLVFSRILGTKHLLVHIVGVDCVKFTKNVVQESLEALGYTIILISFLTQREE